MNLKMINWFGLVGGILIVILVGVSYFFASPWWQISLAEDDFVKVNISPLTTSFVLLGKTRATPPLILALNITALLFFTAAAIVLLIYSMIPTRSYSMHLLGFAWKKPLYAVVIFVVSLVVVSYVAGSYIKVNIPVAGTADSELSIEGNSINFSVTTGFTWTFLLAVVATGFCVAARIYHRIIVPKPKPAPVQIQPQQPPAPPPPPPEKEEEPPPAAQETDSKTGSSPPESSQNT
jgi:hypothetical protein